MTSIFGHSPSWLNRNEGFSPSDVLCRLPSTKFARLPDYWLATMDDASSSNDLRAANRRAKGREVKCIADENPFRDIAPVWFQSCISLWEHRVELVDIETLYAWV